MPTYLSDSTCEAHANSTEVILGNYRAIINAIGYLQSDVKGVTRFQANNLLKEIEELVYAVFGGGCGGHVHKALQNRSEIRSVIEFYTSQLPSGYLSTFGEDILMGLKLMSLRNN